MTYFLILLFFPLDKPPSFLLYPILMKPSANNKTQVIVRGKVYCTMDAYKYKDLNKYLKGVAKEAFDNISKDYDFRGVWKLRRNKFKRN